MNDDPPVDSSEEVVTEDSERQLIEVSKQAAWSGPLPPPSILEQFNDVVENGAERIVSAWEGETAHRQDMERRELSYFGRDSILGKVFAFIFVITALGGSLWAAVNGAEIFATVLGGGTIASVVWAFVKTTRVGDPED